MNINAKMKGALFGILSSVTYGMNPLFGLPLYKQGLTTPTVLFYRFLFAIVLLGVFILLHKESFRLQSPKQVLPMAAGGLLLALSCLFLFLSFHHIGGGLAATILFIYPVMVCCIMYLGFQVKQSMATLTGMVCAIGGICLLSLGDAGEKLSFIGVVFVLLSALSYAVYMVLLKVTSLKNLPSATLTFYAMIFGMPVFLIALNGGMKLQTIPNLFSLGCLLGLAACPSFCSFLFMAIAIKYIGPTKTAVLGALESVTALFFGISCFGETLSIRQLIGIVVILGSVTLVVTARNPVSADKAENGKRLS